MTSAWLRGPYRAGPWPGLTPAGAGVLLGCALLLAGGQLIVGTPSTPMPDLPILAACAFAPLVLATRLTRIPGAAAAVCGAYLLPRSLLSLFDPGLEPPPLLLVPALAFDLTLWLAARDVANLRTLWPVRRKRWPKPNSRPLQPGSLRASLAGGLFGLTLAAIEPPFVVLLGADPTPWSGPIVFEAGVLCTGICAVLALAVGAGAKRSSGRGTES